MSNQLDLTFDTPEPLPDEKTVMTLKSRSFAGGALAAGGFGFWKNANREIAAARPIEGVVVGRMHREHVGRRGHQRRHRATAVRRRGR